MVGPTAVMQPWMPRAARAAKACVSTLSCAGGARRRGCARQAYRYSSAAPPSPRVDVRAFLGRAVPPVTAVEERGDPAVGVVGVDQVVDLAVGRHVQALVVLVGGLHRVVERVLARLRVLDRLE